MVNLGVVVTVPEIGEKEILVMSRTRLCLFVLLAFALMTPAPFAQGKITSPKEQFGHNIGDDYQLVNYAQLVEYWNKLARESDRLKLVEIGKTAEGRAMLMAIITSPENHKKLARYKEIAGRLARAEGLTDEQASAMAHEGRAVVWIDGGLHATEVLGAQQLLEMAYQMASMNDPETVRLLNDDILLMACVNPDGMDLVSNWYMREAEPTRRSTAGLPRLYQKYIGHDNNRDFYMSNQPETEAINRVFYLDWYPQIVYNHHQTGPAGTVLFAPPFRDPFNYYFDPLVPMGLDLVSAAMHNRFVAEGKPGATMRSGAPYSTWWNGGLRTTVYFHNMIGLLTEAIGNPTPIEIPFVPQNQLPRGDLPAPIAPQKWHFRQSIEYEITANRAVLDVASKYREEFLFNIYRMGKNAIERGSRDNWTIHPKALAPVSEAAAKEREAAGSGRGRGGTGSEDRPFGSGPAAVPLKLFEMLRQPADRDPRGYIIPSDQPDFLTATKFVNALIKTGIVVHRATQPFEVSGKMYPAGSYIVKSAQAFRPHVLDMFEPQDHPDDVPFPGGPPRPPYDSAGWTLAFQMGVQFDRILDGFDGPFEKIAGFAKAPSGNVSDARGAAGFLLSHQVNDAFIAVNRLLAANEEIYWLKTAISANGRQYPIGTMFVPAGGSTAGRLQKLAAELGLNFEAVALAPKGEALKLRPVRIGLWDRYGGSMPSGWVRWLLEKFEFPFEVVYPQTLDAGNLNAKYDVLIFVTGAIPSGEAGGTGMRGEGFFGREPDAASIPAEFRGWLGNMTAAKTVPQLKKFVEEGGTLLAIGSSTSMAYHAGLPVANHLVERLPSGQDRPLPRERFYIPGSLVQVRVDPTDPLAYGMGSVADVFFDNSPVLRLRPDALLKGVRPIAWFDGKKPLRSGWALGEGYLDQGVAVVDAVVGRGRLLLYAPEITFRGQPHGTFKFLFNGIYYGKAEAVSIP
jgi:hypothetical protein